MEPELEISCVLPAKHFDDSFDDEGDFLIRLATIITHQTKMISMRETMIFKKVILMNIIW